MARGPDPSTRRYQRPPRRKWQAAIRPHWTEIAIACLLVAVGVGQICVYLRQATIMEIQASITRDQLTAENSLLDLTTRAILINQIKTWRINSIGEDQSPVISFEIKNVGHTHALIFWASYEYAIAPTTPTNFGNVTRIPDFPAMLSPEVDATIIIG